MKRDLILLVILFLAGVVYPLTGTEFLAIPIMALLFVGWATSWDILGGWAGQVSLGHVAFVGIGAYFVAVGAEHYGWAPWWSLLLAVGFSMILALVWGALTFRLQGVYFAMSTIAIAEVIRMIVINENWLSGGATGVFIISLPTLMGFDLLNKVTQFYLALGFAVFVLLWVIVLSRSRLGYQLRAVREDEQSAMAAGINPLRAKLVAFVISAMLTTLG
ncbi:MAG: branched-chain amino acid ABC transporter permease, partial [Castellaniella sp.]